MSSLKFNNVSLKFGGITALNNVSFEVKPKTLYAIIGPNGAGKTSIFNCISGIYRPTHGSVTYGDNDIKELRPDQVAELGIARTFQNIELFENMTVLEDQILLTILLERFVCCFILVIIISLFLSTILTKSPS